ncbi:hypothetical protein N8222_09070 [Oceanospirillaceae bacterium]|nr:hypothetical protein [Oceanospirillaceae bacterium]
MSQLMEMGPVLGSLWLVMLENTRVFKFTLIAKSLVWAGHFKRRSDKMADFYTQDIRH